MELPSSLVRRTLFGCIFLYVASETLLSPFYPQFFRKVFGVQEWEYTGQYIFFCRFAVLICAPLWGVAARYVEVKYLLFAGQGSAGLLTLVLANVTTAREFLIVSILLVAVKSSYLLLYPLIVQLVGQDHSPALAARYQGVFHAAIIMSTFGGAWMIMVPAPLRLFYGVATAEFAQLILCVSALRNVRTSSHPANCPPIRSTRSAGALVAVFGCVLVTFHLATNLIRPYFTAYLMADPVPALSLTSSGLVFLIPSMMALVAMPAIRRLCTLNRLPMIYLSAMALAAASLFLQTWADNVVVLVGSRMIYGVVIAIGHAALDVRILTGSRLQDVPTHYSWSAAAQSIGLLSAPLVATSLVDTSGLTAPLFAAAWLCLFNLAVAGAIVLRNPGFARTPATNACKRSNS